jgi:hypothetical protein
MNSRISAAASKRMDYEYALRWHEKLKGRYHQVLGLVVNNIMSEGIEDQLSPVIAYAAESLKEPRVIDHCERTFSHRWFSDFLGDNSLELPIDPNDLKSLACKISNDYISSRSCADRRRLAGRVVKIREEKNMAKALQRRVVKTKDVKVLAMKQQKADKYYSLRHYVERIRLNPSFLDGCPWTSADRLNFKGIYFLFSTCGELLYIGASTDVSRRVTKTHPIVKIYGEFNIYVRWFRELEDDRDLEALLIARLLPPFNEVTNMIKDLPLPTILHPPTEPSIATASYEVKKQAVELINCWP